MDKKIAETASATRSPQVVPVTPGSEVAAAEGATETGEPPKPSADEGHAIIKFRPTSPIGIDYGVNGKASQRKHTRNLTITQVYETYQAKDLGVKENWKVVAVAGQNVKTASECDAAIRKARSTGMSFEVAFKKGSGDISQDSIMDAIQSDFMGTRPMSQRMFNKRTGISGTTNKLPGLDESGPSTGPGLLRRAGSAHSLSSAMKVSDKLPRYQVNERILGNWQGRGEWFPAIISKIKPGGSFLVSWAADVSDSYLESRQIRRLPDDVPVQSPHQLWHLGQEGHLRWREKNQTIYYGAHGDKVYFWKYYKDWRMGSWFQSKHTPWNVFSQFPEATMEQIRASDEKQHKSIKEIRELPFNSLARYAANIGLEVKFYNADRKKLLGQVLEERQKQIEDPHHHRVASTGYPPPRRE